MSSPLLCLVTDRHRLAHATRGDDAGPLLDLIADAVEAGVELVQVREPDLSTRMLVDVVERAQALADGTDTRVLVNDRVDVALAAGAGGVHLKGASASPESVRAIAPSAWWIGRSVHGVEEAAEIGGAGAVDYLVYGTVFETVSKPGVAAAGLEALRVVVERTPVPVLGIGGMCLERASDVARSGAAGMAVVGAFVAAHEAGTLNRVVTDIRRAFDRGGSAPL